MKKSFKTIMALTAALAISMSGMSMTIADEDPTPPTTQSVVYEDGDGKFDDAAPIPVTMGTEHVLSVTIDFGDMAMNFDLTDTSAENDYGWGNSFKNGNNKITLTNNSTCPVNADITLNIDTETYQFLKKFDFKFSYYDYQMGKTAYGTNFGDVLTYSGDPKIKLEPLNYNTTTNYYLEATNKKPTDMADMHNYNFNNTKIGQWTITLQPNWQTL